MNPLAIDLFCGLGGWTNGLLLEGYDVIGFDIERHEYGEHRYPAQLVIQDVLTLHGSQFKNAALIVASPPCQEFSYMAMPWSKAKEKRTAILADETGAARAKLTELFDACFRIQREACEAAGRHIPLIVENVRGANEWVGRSRWSYGSFHLWGDVPALMPQTRRLAKVPGFRFDGSGRSFQTISVEHTGVKNGGDWFGSGVDCSLQRKFSGSTGIKRPGINLSEVGFNVANTREFGEMVDGIKIVRSERDKRDYIGTKRKFASAMIAKIPLPLSRWIAATFKPDGSAFSARAATHKEPTE
jgi:C-5 cytosine-specific DNA methylase